MKNLPEYNPLHSWLGQFKYDNLKKYALEVKENNIEGNVLELGVAKGGSAKLLSKIFDNKIIYLFDTFSGLPNAVEGADGFFNGDMAVSEDYVRSFLTDCNNIEIFPGYFPDTLNEKTKNDKYCFLHFDGDTYRSTQDFFINLFDKVNSGGIIVVDDYGDLNYCKYIKPFVDEFIKYKNCELTAFTDPSSEKLKHAVIKIL